MTVRRDEDTTEIETKALSPSSTIKAEANLVGLPFFALSRREVRNRSKTEYKVSVRRDGERLDVLWKVSANAEYGYPGPFDRKVHKAIEYIINERGIPIDNPIPFSMYQIIKILELNSSGRTRHRIRQSLVRIFSASVTSEGAFYSKAKKQYISDNFHIYDRVVFKEQTLPNGDVADTNYLFLSQWYLESINAFYIKPLNFAYLRELRSDIAGRLYELLSLKFYGVLSNRRSYWKVEYRELCDLLPITLQKYPSHAKQYLEPAHTELTKTEFLSKVVWDTEDRKHWYILYYPGRRAREEVKAKPIQERLQLEAPQEVPLDTSEDTTHQQKLVSALHKRGVSKKQASRLVKDHSDWIKRGIELWELEKKKNPDGMKNPAGYLVSIIKAGEDWQPPDDYVSPEEQERKKEKKRKTELLKELKEVTDEASASELLSSPKDEISSEELELEVARVREEKETREKEVKAAIQKVLAEMSEEELSALKEEVLSKVDVFYRSLSGYQEITEKDVREWRNESLTEIYLRGLRDLIIREKYLGKE